MASSILLSGVFVLVIVVGLFMIVRNNRSFLRKQQPFDGTPRAERLAYFISHLRRRDELLNLLQLGQKINAIKLFREDTGASLKDAKDAVESIMAEYQVASLSGAAPSLAQSMRSANIGMPAPGLDEAALASIMVHLRNKQKINAIKVYRQYTGASLRDAKNAVEALEAMMYT